MTFRRPQVTLKVRLGLASPPRGDDSLRRKVFRTEKD